MTPTSTPGAVPLAKRILDLVLTLPAMLILLPLMGFITLLIWLLDGRPIFFRQPRPGYRGEIFTLTKFRTMRCDVDTNGVPLPDGRRLTRLGRILRATSLDELPEFFQVISGRMSLVGPRPLLTAYLDRYSPEQARRHDVLPGITGWAQVNGRNALSWEDKFKLDVWYVDHWSVGLDLKILALTIWKTLKREGVSQPGQATAEEFKGSPQEPPAGQSD
ncbi:MAG TPA: sugar transferase [Anaerolineaceae bacterium]|jgi:lipopolysaccharide/colanic/teichoic acid biosynthesis glycosyltransferase|nr:sugar transferase [Anaerolineaceae bacterium]